MKSLSDKKEKLAKKELENAQKLAQAVNRQTQAYMNQAQALAGLETAKGNAQIIMLERRKFEERLHYEMAGQDDVAQQIGLAYDVEIQRQKNLAQAKQARLQERQAEQAASSSVRIAQMKMAETDIAKAAYDEAQERYEKKAAKKGNASNIRQMTYLKNAAERARLEYEKAKIVEEQALDDIQVKRAKVGESYQTTANVQLGGQLTLEQAMLAYDNFVSETGNVGNFTFQTGYIEKLNNLADKWNYMEETAKNTEDLSRKLDELLKQKEF